jgi:hypothetical protein
MIETPSSHPKASAQMAKGVVTIVSFFIVAPFLGKAIGKPHVLSCFTTGS